MFLGASIGLKTGVALAGANVWTTGGPEGGRVQCLAIDPVTPATVYAGTFGAGVFKSVNAEERAEPGNLDRPDESQAIHERIRLYLRRHGDNGRIDPERRLRAVSADYANRRAGEADRGLAQQGVGGSNWVSLGPTNGAGRMTAIAPHPTISGTLYVGAADGGVWKTTDRGLSWTPLTDAINDLSVGAIGISASSPNIIYLGSGEGGYGADFIPGIGLLKSTDGGASWSLPASVIATAFYRVSVHPTNPLELIVGTSQGGLRSTDGGTTWAPVISRNTYGDVTDIVRHPTSPQILYAATWCINGCAAGAARILKSTDGGVTWTSKSAGLPASTSQNGYERLSLAISTSSPLVLYAATALYDSGSGDIVSHIYRTTDGGESWADLPAVSSSSQYAIQHYLSYQSWYDNVLVVSPTDSNTVVAGGVSYVRSTDGGSSFSSPFLGHVDAHDLRYEGSTLYVANDGGIWSSSDNGQSVTDRNIGLVTFQYYAMANDPVNRSRILAGSQDNGTHQRPDAGGTLWRYLLGGDGIECGINPLAPDVAYGTYPYGYVARTKDAGASAKDMNAPGFWSPITPPYPPNEQRPFLSALTIDPSKPSTLYTGTSRVWRSMDGGDSWTALPTTTTDGSTWNLYTISSIAVARSNSSILMVGGAGDVFRSTNGGASWVRASSGLPSWWVNNLEIDPANPAIAYAALATTFGQSLYQTTNGGASWVQRYNGLPPFAAQVIRVDPTDSNILYCGTDVGVYRSVDQGGSWTTFGTGLPNSSVQDLRVLEDASILRVATHGRAVWELQVPPTGNTPPTAAITSPSGPLTVRKGTAVTFSGFVSDPDVGDTVTGQWTLTDTWETVPTGAGSSTLSHTFARAGLFPVSLAARDNHGALGNASVSVSVPEAADDCATPLVVPAGGPFPYTVLVNSESASKQASDPQPTCSPWWQYYSLWFEFTPAISGSYELSTCGGPIADTVLSVFTGPVCGPYTEVACDDDAPVGSICQAEPFMAVATVTATTGGTLRIQLTSQSSNTGMLPLTIRPTTSPITAPRVTGISKGFGPTTGNTPITLFGANFAAGSSVTFGGIPATDVTLFDPTTLGVTTPPRAAGPVDVVVTNPDTTFGTLGSGFTYVGIPPAVATNAASGIGQSGAALNGVVNPNGSSTSAYFEYGNTTGYGGVTTPQSIGAGTSNVPVMQPIEGLVCNTIYHFRVVATNGNGRALGLDQTFSTNSCTPAAFYTVAPCRVADTRDSPGPSGGPGLATNTVRTFPVANICGIPPSATAVAINIAVFLPTDGGDLRVYPTGGTAPLASTINFRPGIVRANNAIVPLGAGGQISVQCDMPPGSSGSTNFFFDVYGYFQ